jgi:hypothetical protein
LVEQSWACGAYTALLPIRERFGFHADQKSKACLRHYCSLADCFGIRLRKVPDGYIYSVFAADALAHVVDTGE